MKEFPKAWERLYPVAYGRILERDPLRMGIRTVKRKAGTYSMFNFRIFMPKYQRLNRETVAQKEGRELLAFFLWNPNLSEEPYRIELGEPLEGN